MKTRIGSNTHWLILEDHDVEDLQGNTATYANKACMFGARYGWTFDDDGVPSYGQIDLTQGPIGGWLCWPGADPRVLSQWGQVFAAQITTSGGGSLKATPVFGNSGSAWVNATDLQELDVAMPDGSFPPVGTYGLVVAGTNLDEQEALFFKGSSGSSLLAFRIASPVGGGVYNAVQIDPVLGSDLTGGAAFTTARCQEMNLSTNVGANSKVYCQKETSSGLDYYVFVLDMASCT